MPFAARRSASPRRAGRASAPQSDKDKLARLGKVCAGNPANALYNRSRSAIMHSMVACTHLGHRT